MAGVDAFSAHDFQSFPYFYVTMGGPWTPYCMIIWDCKLRLWRGPRMLLDHKAVECLMTSNKNYILIAGNYRTILQRSHITGSKTYIAKSLLPRVSATLNQGNNKLDSPTPYAAM